jgi:GxxExxY protein
MDENAIAKEIVDAAFRIHTTLGPGLLESVYNAVLAHELGRRGLHTLQQQSIPVVYENIRIDTGFRADLVVEDKVIVEIKSIDLIAGPQKAAFDLSPAGRQTSWLAHQFQRGSDQGRHHPHCQRVERLSFSQSRQVAKTHRDTDHSFPWDFKGASPWLFLVSCNHGGTTATASQG